MAIDSQVPQFPATTRVTVEIPKGEEAAFQRLYMTFLSGDEAADAAIRARAADQEQGIASLHVLADIATGDSGQSRVVAQFLMGLYNGFRFKFDLTDFRSLDRELFEHCLAVLRLDYSPQKEVHEYLENGTQRWRQMIADWGVANSSTA